MSTMNRETSGTEQFYLKLEVKSVSRVILVLGQCSKETFTITSSSQILTPVYGFHTETWNLEGI